MLALLKFSTLIVTRPCLPRCRSEGEVILATTSVEAPVIGGDDSESLAVELTFQSEGY